MRQRQAAVRASFAAGKDLLRERRFVGGLFVRERKKEVAYFVFEFLHAGAGRDFPFGHLRIEIEMGSGEKLVEHIEAVRVRSHFSASEIFQIGVLPVVEIAELLDSLLYPPAYHCKLCRRLDSGDLHTRITEEAAARGLKLYPAQLGGFELLEGIFEFAFEHFLEVGRNVDARDLAL